MNPSCSITPEWVDNGSLVAILYLICGGLEEAVPGWSTGSLPCRNRGGMLRHEQLVFLGRIRSVSSMFHHTAPPE